MMRYESAACVRPSANQAYITGVGENRKETWKWDPESGWKQCADMNQGRRRHCVAFGNSTSMYVLGGVDSDQEPWILLDSIEEYDVEANRWTEVARLMNPTCYAACVSHNNSIYVFGGRGDLFSKSSLRRVQVFNTTSRVFSELAQSLPRPMQMLRAVQWDRSVVIFGTHDCVTFDLELKTFRARHQFATKACYFKCLR